jgi:LPXTG-site transpeptidase (sortase) family protein
MADFFSHVDWLPWAIGLALGLGVIFLLRARQAWYYRQSFGYDAYAADRRRRGFNRWAGVAVVIALLAGGVFLIRFALTAGGIAPRQTAGRAPADPLADMKLVIPRLGLKLAVIESALIGQGWDISQLTDQAAHLEGTSYPGHEGNAALAAHVTIPGAGWGPFKDLESLQPGDSVFIETPDSTYSYLVTERFTAAPTDVRLVLPTDDTRLTLMTCAGWDGSVERYAQRVIVIARLVP